MQIQISLTFFKVLSLMIINIFGISLGLHLPVSKSYKNFDEIVLRFCGDSKMLPIDIPDGFRISDYTPKKNFSINYLYRKAGLPLTKKQFNEALYLCIPGGIHLIENIESKEIVSIMMSRHLSNDDFPFGGRIDWLATDPDYRGLGLGRISATMALNKLLERGYQSIWVTTQSHRQDAIKIFETLGFIKDC
jgi:GNAT superfamily N-acetyltransferase